MTAFLMAVGYYNNSSNVQGAWVYHGRNDSLRQDTIGLMFRIMPIAMRFTHGKSMKSIFEEMRDQIRHCIIYNSYPFALDMFNGVYDDRASCIFQSDIYDISAL